ncbi:MAG: hypothetical protein ACRDRZ_01645, partial [Pseudonocardiaceae bacterium]
PSGARRSLAARARQRGSVLLPLGRWPGADVELSCRAEAWRGAEAGHGRLRSREVVVHAVGRGAAGRPSIARLLLPGPGGPVADVVPEAAPINPPPDRTRGPRRTCRSTRPAPRTECHPHSAQIGAATIRSDRG